MAYRELGRLARTRGDTRKAAVELELAQSYAKRVDDRRLLAECSRDVAYLCLAQGMLDLAEEYFLHARGDYDVCGDVLGRARCDLGLGELAREAGRLDDARRFVDMAKKGFEGQGSRKGVSECLNALGEVARLEGDLVRAEGYYREALEIRRAIGAANAFVCELNLGLVQIARGLYGEARATLSDCLTTVERQQNRRMMGCIHVCLLVPSIALGNSALFDQHLKRAATLLAETGIVDVDNARLAALAGDLANTQGESGRARDAYFIARDQWKALGREIEERDIATKLSAIGVD